MKSYKEVSSEDYAAKKQEISQSMKSHKISQGNLMRKLRNKQQKISQGPLITISKS